DHHSIDDAEHGRGRTNPQRERQNSRNAEGRIPAKHSGRVTEFLKRGFDKRSGVHFVNLFSDSREIRLELNERILALWTKVTSNPIEIIYSSSVGDIFGFAAMIGLTSVVHTVFSVLFRSASFTSM